jgi:hypothetical protein
LCNERAREGKSRGVKNKGGREKRRRGVKSGVRRKEKE